MASVFILVLFFVSSLVILSSSTEEKKYCSSCPPFPCGHLGPVQFPFNNKTNPECGLFTVDCPDNNHPELIPKIQLKGGGHWYQAYRISQADSVSICDTVPTFYGDSHPCESIRNFSLPGSSPMFSYDLEGTFLTLFNCSQSLGISKPIEFNRISCGDYEIYYNPQNQSFPFEQQCSIIQFPLALPVPIPEEFSDPHLKECPVSKFTFEVKVSHDCSRCHSAGGKRWANSQNRFECLNERKRIYIYITYHLLFFFFLVTRFPKKASLFVGDFSIRVAKIWKFLNKFEFFSWQKRPLSGKFI